jgi:uncharacterized protein YraI
MPPGIRTPTAKDETMNFRTQPVRVAGAVGAVIAAGTTTFLALATGSASADEPGRCTQNVNVREEPDTNSRIVALCETGTQVMLGAEREGWVKLDSLGGWASKDFVKPDENAAGSTGSGSHASDSHASDDASDDHASDDRASDDRATENRATEDHATGDERSASRESDEPSASSASSGGSSDAADADGHHPSSGSSGTAQPARHGSRSSGPIGGLLG